jgi:hypothetical protein
MKNMQANYGFTISEENGKKIFNYKKEKYKIKNLLPLMVSLPLISIILVFLMDAGDDWMGTWLILTLGSFFGAMFLLNLTRGKGSFVITEDAIEVRGSRYLKKDINSIFIQEGNSKPLADLNMNHSTGTFVGFRANPGGMMAMSAMNAAHGVGKIADAAGDRLRKNMAKLNCKVGLRHGSRKVIIAKGLTIDTAEVMMNKIVELS